VIVPEYNKVVFFVIVLISLSLKDLNGQVQRGDTLKKVSADTLTVPEEGDEIEQQVQYSGEDSVVGLPQQGKVLLYGKAKVNYGTMDMQAEYIEIDYNKNLISAYGKKDSLGKNVGTPVFKDGGETPIEAEKIVYNLKTKRGKIFNALTKQGELLVVGNEIKKDSNNIIYMKNMKCIPCQDDDARTVFRASRAKIIPDDKIVTGPMFLEIGGVPTPLGLPFGYFPNTKKQHNGILLPRFGNSPNQGYNLKEGGFYWGINDRTDMIIRGDIYTNGSYVLSTNNNYNVLYKSSGAVFLSFSRFNIGDRDIPKQFSQQQAYDVRWQHAQDNKQNPSIRFNADVNYRSNQTFNRLNAINSEQFLQNQFLSNISFAKSFKFSSLSINAQHNQNSQTRDMNIIFPSMVFNINSFFPFKKETHVNQNALDKVRMSYVVEANNTLSGKDTVIFKGAYWDRMKYGIRHNLPISTSFNIFKYINATPQINLSSMMYTKSIRKDLEYQNIGSADHERDSLIPVVRTKTLKQFSAGYDASFSTSLKTQVYFDYFFRRGKVSRIRHLLIPDLTYQYRPDFGEEQYGFWKQVQLDSLGRKGYYSIFENSIYSGPQRGEISSLSLNLNNNFEGKIKQRTDTGVTFKKVVLLQNISASGSYNFAADTMKMSPLGLSARSRVLKYFDVVAGATFDPYAFDHQLNRRINVYAYDRAQSLARLVNARFTVNTSIGSDMLTALRKSREKPKISSGVERGVETDLNTNAKLPWNLSMYYTLELTNINDYKLQPTHALQLSGDLMPTKYWKVGISSGFDFLNKKISYTRFSIYRDLKCWQAQIDWVPYGISKSYSIAVNLKTSMLSEFKIPRQRSWFDNFQ
jgi:hypothetical protein